MRCVLRFACCALVIGVLCYIIFRRVGGYGVLVCCVLCDAVCVLCVVLCVIAS